MGGNYAEGHVVEISLSQMGSVGSSMGWSQQGKDGEGKCGRLWVAHAPGWEQVLHGTCCFYPLDWCLTWPPLLRVSQAPFSGGASPAIKPCGEQSCLALLSLGELPSPCPQGCGQQIL